MGEDRLRLVVAAVLALPVLLFTVLTIPIHAILALPAAYCLLSRKPNKKSNNPPPQQQSPTTSRRRQVIVTGGSSGIGLALAQDCRRPW